MPLSDFDDEIDAIDSPPSLDDLPAKHVPNGFHTLTFPCGTHRTFRIRTERGGIFKGKRTVGLLIGPDNTADYQTVGLLTSGGITMFKAQRNTRTADNCSLLWSLLNGEVIDGHEVQTSRRCFICNKPLTDSESIRTGVGPTCRNRK